MRRGTAFVSTLAPVLAVASAAADVPQLGGPMSHLLVSVFDQQVFVTYESPQMSTVELQRPDASFDGPASVLNGRAHNAQFGWLANGFISLPSGSGVFVERTSSSVGLDVYEESSLDAILGTNGASDVWQWDGSMTHNWYAADTFGTLSATYSVFVGDSSGQILDGWGAAQITLTFVNERDPYGAKDPNTLPGPWVQVDYTGPSVPVSPVPSPSGLAVLAAAPVLMRRRR